MNQLKEKLPKPIGEYVVGIMNLDFEYEHEHEHENEYENEHENRIEKRKIPLTVFYPSDSDEGKNSIEHLTSEVYEMLFVAFENMKSTDIKRVDTNCFLNVELSKKHDSFPLVIFNHEYFGFERQNTVLCSDLASSGYIVVSVGHPGTSAVVRYMNGELVTYNNENFSENELIETDGYVDLLYKIAVSEEDAEIIELTKDFYFMSNGFDSIVEVWEKDTIGALEFLISLKLDKESNFYKKIITDKVAVIGHSLGGTTAALLCKNDNRFICGIDLDGAIFGGLHGIDIKKPFLTISTDFVWKLNRSLYNYNSSDSNHLVIKDCTHLGFTDFKYVSDSVGELKLGKIEPMLIREIINKYCMTFLGRYLNNEDIDIIDLNYQEATLFRKAGK